MKPKTLTMQAFGSYGAKVTIDFTKLNQNLFLITGDTGSGKSTIFDAIVFALYGEASSNNSKKEGIEFQSQFVDTNVEPFVELIFEENKNGFNEEYTIRRVPRHQRRNNKTLVKESVSLTMPDLSSPSLSTSECQNKIEEIVGLTKEQFMQVAMIAQGEFIELLRAKSDKKKEIFRKLFNTAKYERIIDKFRTLAKAKEAEIETIKTICQNEVSHIEVPEDYSKAQLINDMAHDVATSKHFNIAEMENLINELAELCQILKLNYENDNKAKIVLEKEVQSLNEEYNQALVLIKSFETLELETTKLKQFDDNKINIEKLKALSTLIKSAYEIKPIYDKNQERLVLLTKTQKDLIDYQEQKPLLSKTYEDIKAKYVSLKTRYDDDNNQYLKTKKMVDDTLYALNKIAEENKQFNQNQTALTKAKLDLQQVNNDLQTLNSQELAWRKLESDLNNTPVLLNEINVQIEKLTDLVSDIDDLHKDHVVLSQLFNDLEEAKKDYLTIRDEHINQNQEYLNTQNAFFDAQAGLIASKLEINKPCPVCGSLIHPNPCKLSFSHQNLTREMVDELAARLKTLEIKLNAASTKSSTTKALYDDAKTKYQNKLAKLINKLENNYQNLIKSEDLIALKEKQLSLNIFKEQVLKLIDDKNIQKSKLQKDVDVLDKTRGDLLSVNTKRAKFEEDLQKRNLNINKLQSLIDSAKATIKTLEAQKQYASKEIATKALNDITAIKNKSFNTLNDFENKQSQAKTKLENNETLLLKAQKDLPIIEENYQESLKEYKELLVQYQLDEVTWKEYVNSYQKSDIQELDKQVKDYNDGLIQTQTAINTALKAINGKNKPNLELIAKDKLASESKLETAKNKLDALNLTYQGNYKIYKALAPVMEDRKEIVKKHAMIDGLYKRLSGMVAGSNKMDIETYAQRYYLERIIHAANLRFEEMSAGQFLLRMKDDEEAGSGKNKGLDLMVYSNITGKEREIRTLSGGESFMAALSLALGMADQIQANSSVINLDMMFIDEGFGSLDNHSRDQAVKVLKQMAGGSKLIGIISHVNELKQEIDNQLIVTKDEKGSHVKWQIS